MMPSFLVFIALVGAAGQLCLKKSAISSSQHALTIKLAYLCIGITLLLSNVFLLAHALRTTPLTLAMPVTALVYVFTPLGAKLFFKEYQNRSFWFGAVLIICGLAVITLSKG